MHFKKLFLVVLLAMGTLSACSTSNNTDDNASKSVALVTAVPNSVNKDKKEEIAQNLAKILELDKDEILNKLNKRVSSELLLQKLIKKNQKHY